MTKEEIINAAIELVDYGTGQHNADSPIECFKKGAEFMDNHWQEKTRWIPVEEKLPEARETPYFIAIKYKVAESDSDNIGAICIYDKTDVDYILLEDITHWKEIE